MTVMRARDLAQAGNLQAAQEVLDQVLRAEPYNVEAWRLAVEIAPTEALRANARSGLQRAMAIQQPVQMVPAQAAYPAPQQISANPAQPYPARPYEKDYLGEAFITLLLYYLGFGIVGLIANVLFISNASRDRRSGVPVRNAGCLQALLIVHLGAIVLTCGMALLFFVILPMIGITFSALMGY